MGCFHSPVQAFMSVSGPRFPRTLFLDNFRVTDYPGVGEFREPFIYLTTATASIFHKEFRPKQPRNLNGCASGGILDSNIPVIEGANDAFAGLLMVLSAAARGYN